MSFLVAQIYPATDMDSVADVLATIHPLKDPTIEEIRALFARTDKYQIPENILMPARATDWPFTALVYTSRSRKGIGRSGSALYRIPVRIKEQGGGS